ncbi:hypothetical protein [Salinigranum halophilum]|jgi:hypothetical protein|uniref:hypothetical protein n=1 Tax=Salinigranum halophilum TaxID=2565931 RepID=UPI00191BD24B|nr:hypothetical protein [Salinigranum halophilum]
MTGRRTDSSRDLSDVERPLDDLVADLASTLRATEELPVAPSASTWLGEAQAVAEDLARGGLDDAVVRERVGHVHRLLTSAGDPDNDAAAAHVDDAVTLAETILAHLDADGDDEASE